MKNQHSGPPSLRGESGLTVTMMMIALALVGILVTAISSLSSNSLHSIKVISTIGEAESLRNLIRIRMDCGNTLAKLQPGAATHILYGRDGQPLTPIDGGIHKFQRWEIRVAAYNVGTGDFDVRVNHPHLTIKDSPLFAVAPLTCGLP